MIDILDVLAVPHLFGSGSGPDTPAEPTTDDELYVPPSKFPIRDDEYVQFPARTQPADLSSPPRGIIVLRAGEFWYYEASGRLARLDVRAGTIVRRSFTAVDYSRTTTEFWWIRRLY